MNIKVLLSRTLASACLCMLSLSVFAQDIIVTKDSKKITAKVIEVNQSEIKYKNFANLDGPTYSITKSKIASIIYQSGEIDVFTEEDVAETPVATKNQVAAQDAIELLSIDEQLNVLNSVGKKLNAKEVQNIMQAAPNALALYNSGRRLKKVGNGILIPGVIVGLVGCGLIPFAFGEYNTDYGMLYTGATFCATGLVAELVGVSIVGSGNRRIKQSVFTYNGEIKKKTTADVSLKFGITRSGGLGFTLTF